MKHRTPLAFLRESLPLLKRAGLLALAGLYLFVYTASNIPSMHHHPVELAARHQAPEFPGSEKGKHADNCPLCLWQAMGQDVPHAAALALPLDFDYSTPLFVSEPVAFESSALRGSVSARGPPVRFSA